MCALSETPGLQHSVECHGRDKFRVLRLRASPPSAHERDRRSRARAMAASRDRPFDFRRGGRSSQRSRRPFAALRIPGIARIPTIRVDVGIDLPALRLDLRVRPCAQSVIRGVASIGGLLLAGVQLVPSFDLLATSVRRTVETDFSLSYSLHPLNLAQLFSPYLLLNRIYASPAERIIHEFGLVRRRTGNHRVHMGAHPSTQTAFPPAGGVRSCCVDTGPAAGSGKVRRGVRVVHDGTARRKIPCARTAHHTGAFRPGRPRRDPVRGPAPAATTRAAGSSGQSWLWTPLLLSVGIAALAWWRPQIWTTFPDQPLYGGGMVIGAVLLAFVTLLLRDGSRGSYPALMLLPFVAAIDLGLWGYPYAFAAGMHTVGELADLAAPPPGASPDPPCTRRPEVRH